MARSLKSRLTRRASWIGSGPTGATSAGDPPGRGVLASLRRSRGFGAGRAPPYDRFNRSAISTIVVAAVTSNLRLAAMPGNVRLRRGEAGLLLASVINISQLRTVDRSRLVARVGALGPAR